MFNIFAKDLVVFITGTNNKNGIGRALIEEALKRGAKKVYATARDISHLNDLVDSFPNKVTPVQLDVTKKNQVKHVAKTAADTQILINNAGSYGFTGCLDNYDEKIAIQEMQVNYFAPLHLIHAFAKNIMKNGSGSIVNIISIAGLYPSPTNITYSASKAALYSLTQAVRIEMAINNLPIPVFGVYPGPIDTDGVQEINVRKGSPKNLAIRVFDGMEQGILDITTDELSDHFRSFLKKDTNAIEKAKKNFLEAKK